jgi:hypothetical protein
MEFAGEGMKPLLTLYAVRSCGGLYFGKRGLWATELKDARIYPRIGSARRIVTDFANSGAFEHIPEIIGLEVTNLVVFMEDDRVKKSQEKKAKKEAKYRRRDAAYELERAQRQMAEAQEVIARLSK